MPISIAAAQEEDPKRYWLPVDLGLLKLPISAFGETPEPAFWVGTEKGLFKIKALDAEGTPQMQHFLPQEAISTLCTTPAGEIFLATYSQQIFKIEAQTSQISPLPALKVVPKKLVAGQEQDLWLLTQANELYHYQNQKWTQKSLPKLSQATLYDLLPFAEGLLLATSNGVFIQLEDEKKQKWQAVKSVLQAQVFQTYQTEAGERSIFMMGFDKKSRAALFEFRLKSSNAKQILKAFGKPTQKIELPAPWETQGLRTLAINQKGEIFSVADKILRISNLYPKNTKTKEKIAFQFYSFEQGFESKSGLCIWADSQDNIWVGTEGRGLFIYLQNPIEISQENSLVAEKITNPNREKTTFSWEDLTQEAKKNPTLTQNWHNQTLPLPIAFELQKATLQAEYQEKLASFLPTLLSILEKNPSLVLQIEGHTEPIGNAALNLKLSQARAQAVADFLVQKGISASRLRVQGFGGNRPIEKKGESDPKKSNRRVELRLLFGK
ncbi:OmpA family protein [Hugenholtzia roseola]|uniref:OmpA family protein n=1 Tax=Hugenholtzia roseola TaxID=1002 RepID=UPI00041546E5|nr:OmpA family protein [Hugenholtzia roseola]